MDDEIPLPCNQVIAALDPVLVRLGFERHQRGLHEAPTSGDDILASWGRAPAATTGWRGVEGEGVSVWRDAGDRTPGYVNVRIGTIHTRVEWRRTDLDGDEFAAIIEAFIRRFDGFRDRLRR